MVCGQPAASGNGGTIGFACQPVEQADALDATGIAHGGGTPCEEPPGVREGAGGNLCLAYRRDPDGSKVCDLSMPRS